MKKIVGFLSFFMIGHLHAQELNLPAQTQYLADNPFLITPTFAGIGDNARVRLTGLAQWIGIDDAPRNVSLSADFRIGDRTGLGFSLYNDRNGNTHQMGGKLSYAHHLILNVATEEYLSLGLSFNFNQFKIDIAAFDPTIPDPNVSNNRQTNNTNFDIGFLYRKADFYLAANASNILDKNIEKFYKIEPNKLRNYQAYAGYRYRKTRRSMLELEPSVFFQYFQSDKRSSTDLNMKFRFYDFEDYYWAGITYRFLNDQTLKPLTIGPMAGFKKSHLYLAYSYQITTNKLANYNTGTHMITIGYDFLQNLSNCPCTHDRIVF